MSDPFPPPNSDGTRTVLADASQVLAQLQLDVPAIRAVALVELDSGIHFATADLAPCYHLGNGSLHASELMSLSKRAAHALTVSESAEDLLLTMSDELHLLRLMPSRTTFLHVRADRQSTNVAVLRASIDRHGRGL